MSRSIKNIDFYEIATVTGNRGDAVGKMTRDMIIGLFQDAPVEIPMLDDLPQYMTKSGMLETVREIIRILVLARDECEAVLYRAALENSIGIGRAVAEYLETDSDVDMIYMNFILCNDDGETLDEYVRRTISDLWYVIHNTQGGMHIFLDEALREIGDIHDAFILFSNIACFEMERRDRDSADRIHELVDAYLPRDVSSIVGQYLA